MFLPNPNVLSNKNETVYVLKEVQCEFSLYKYI